LIPEVSNSGGEIGIAAGAVGFASAALDCVLLERYFEGLTRYVAGDVRATDAQRCGMIPDRAHWAAKLSSKAGPIFGGMLVTAVGHMLTPMSWPSMFAQRVVLTC